MDDWRSSGSLLRKLRNVGKSDESGDSGRGGESRSDKRQLAAMKQRRLLITIVVGALVVATVWDCLWRGRNLTNDVAASPVAEIRPMTYLPVVLAPPPNLAPPVPVSYVVDGDTIRVIMVGYPETVRVIGIDTPEVVDPDVPPQCFGPEASAKAKELLGGQMVRLIADPTQATRDRYGRLLRYVERTDGLDFGLWMIRNGYAREYTFVRPYQRQASYRAAEAEARAAGAGLWAPETCNGGAGT